MNANDAQRQKFINAFIKKNNAVHQTTRTYKTIELGRPIEVEETTTEYRCQEHQNYAIVITVKIDNQIREVITDIYDSDDLLSCPYGPAHTQQLTYVGFDGKEKTETHTPYDPVFDKTYAKWAYDIFSQ